LITLKPKEGDGSASFPFERSRGSIPRRVIFVPSTSVPPPRDKLGLYAGDALRTGESGRIPDSNIRYRLEVLRDVFTVRLCVSPENLDPGEYKANIYVTDSRFEERVIPLTVTLQYNGWHLILVALWIGIVVAAIFKWVGGQRAVGVPFRGNRLPQDFFTWIGARFLSLGAAVVAVAALFWSQYWNVHDWGSSPQQLFTLMGAAFAATVTAVSAAEVGKPTAEKDFASKVDPDGTRRVQTAMGHAASAATQAAPAAQSGDPAAQALVAAAKAAGAAARSSVAARGGDAVAVATGERDEGEAAEQPGTEAPAGR
jgi:hypothetical protein